MLKKIDAADGIILISDCTKPESLNITEDMKDYIDSNVRSCDKSRVPCIIIENKIDLLPKEAQMNDTTLKEFSSDNEFYSSFRVSVKDGINRKESMECLLKEII